MGLARRLRSVFGPVLLTVITIQGILPDASDLASRRALYLLGDVLFGLSCEWDSFDSPNEASGQIRPGTALLISALSRAVPAFGPGSDGLSLATIGANALRSSSPGTHLPR